MYEEGVAAAALVSVIPFRLAAPVKAGDRQFCRTPLRERKWSRGYGGEAGLGAGDIDRCQVNQLAGSRGGHRHGGSNFADTVKFILRPVEPTRICPGGLGEAAGRSTQELTQALAVLGIEAP